MTVARRTISLMGWLMLLALALVVQPGLAAAESLSAQAVVEQDQVFVGEAMEFQIKVNGHDNPDPPDLSGLTDFDVQPLGGHQNSSSAITIINGRMSRSEQRGYIFSYQLTPKRAGTLTIPALTVTADKQTAMTKPMQIRAAMPAESDDFKLRLELSSDTVYVGQPVTLTVTWYINKDVEGFEFNLPVLTDDRFDHAPVEITPRPQEEHLLLRFPVAGAEVIGKKGRMTLDDKEYLTVRFQQNIIPRQAGRLVIPPATVACNAVMGYRHGRQRSSFNDPFFDNFFNNSPFGHGKQAVVRKFVTPSNEPTLTVRDLPTTGRPPGFTGLVGSYSIAATAAPTKVRVGDPITLNIMVTGPDYLDNIVLPDLASQADLGRDFKIPTEMAPGTVTNRVKTFTQTVRAKNEAISEIPPIRLDYFDPDKGVYRTASSEPIQLQVESTRVVTARDAEGMTVAAAPKSELETRAGGIAYNYEDDSVLTIQAPTGGIRFNSLLWLAVLLAPPLLYALLLITVTTVRRRRADPEAIRARRAYGLLLQGLNQLTKSPDSTLAHDTALALLRHYLGAKLRLSAEALTVSDISRGLTTAGVATQTVARVTAFFQECEAERYAGATPACSDPQQVAATAGQLAAQLEKELA